MSRDGAPQLLVFRMGTELFGVALSRVHEVIDAPVLNRVPDTPPEVIGVASVRGEMIAVYDPSPLLVPRAAAMERAGAALVFAQGDRRVGIAVDDVLDALFLEESMLRESNGIHAGDRVLRGLVLSGADLIGVLDADALVESATTQSTGERV